MVRGKAGKEPTWTCLVLAALRTQDDFMDYEALRVALKMPKTIQSLQRLSATCIHLRRRNAIGVEITPDGRGWWYAMPREFDNRMKVCDERVPEQHPRRIRKRRIFREAP